MRVVAQKAHSRRLLLALKPFPIELLKAGNPKVMSLETAVDVLRGWQRLDNGATDCYLSTGFPTDETATPVTSIIPLSATIGVIQRCFGSTTLNTPVCSEKVKMGLDHGTSTLKS
jgi:hypothetical protein